MIADPDPLAPQASVDNPPAGGQWPPTIATGGVGLTGYEGAQWSLDSGYIYWPSLDPDREITGYSRIETARKIHYFVANHGLARRVLSGLTNLIVGNGLRPQGLTKDTEWNRLAERSYHNRGSSPLTYDAGGCLTDTRAQSLLVRTTLKDGDAAAVLTKSATGGAMRAFYSGLQIGNSAETELDQSYWTDGVMLGQARRPLKYRFPGANGACTDIPVQDMIFLARYETLGQRRGTSVLSHAIRRMTHITEIDAAVTQNIKASSGIGYYLAADSQAPATGGMAAALKGLTQGGQRQVQASGPPLIGANGQPILDANGKPICSKVNLKIVFGNGNEVAELPPGYDIKTLLDQRPHPNNREFVDQSLVRDIAQGAGVFPELLWNIIKLGGANIRYVMSDAQVFVTIEQQWLVDYYLARDWVFHCACEMAARRLRPCADLEWWYHGWIPPGRTTVDFGRDGAIYLRWYQAGMLTANRWFNLQGQDAREETLQHLDFCAWRKAELAKRNLTMAECYPAAPGAAPAPAASSPTDAEEDEQPEDEVDGHEDEEKDT
jgi:capsid protein